MSNKTLILTYGRFNPPHNGHLIVFDYIVNMANALYCDYEIWISHTHDKKSNWLSQDRKLYYLNKIYPYINFHLTNKQIHSIIPILKLKQDYDNIIVVLGSDRISAFTQLLQDYNDREYHFKNISVVSCADRKGKNIYSSTLVRESVKKNDYLAFQYLLSNISIEIQQELFNELREII